MSNACLHQESSSSSRLQMVGLLSALALSGSVALISFILRKGRWTTTHSHGELHAQDGSKEEDAHTHSHFYGGSFEDNVKSPTHPPKSSHEGNEPSSVTLKSKKKVRFAPDVVEPPCNGQEYRSIWRVSQGRAYLDVDDGPSNDQVLTMGNKPPLHHHGRYKSKRTVSHKCEMCMPFGSDDEPPRNDCVDANTPPYNNDQRHKATCKVSQQDEVHSRLPYSQMPTKSRKASQGGEMHAHLSHPRVLSKSHSSIPPNRLALYKGLRQSQLQYSLHGL